MRLDAFEMYWFLIYPHIFNYLSLESIVTLFHCVGFLVFAAHVR